MVSTEQLAGGAVPALPPVEPLAPQALLSLAATAKAAPPEGPPPRPALAATPSGRNRVTAPGGAISRTPTGYSTGPGRTTTVPGSTVAGAGKGTMRQPLG